MDLVRFVFIDEVSDLPLTSTEPIQLDVEVRDEREFKSYVLSQVIDGLIRWQLDELWRASRAPEAK